jgi:hypothetical protein
MVWLMNGTTAIGGGACAARPPGELGGPRSPCRSRLRLNRGDGRDWALPRRVSRQLGSLGERGAPRRAHEIIAKPCRGGDLQAVGRLFRLELQDLSAGLGAQAFLSATMGTVFTFLLPLNTDRHLFFTMVDCPTAARGIYCSSPARRVAQAPGVYLGFWIDEAAKTLVLADGAPLTVRRFDDSWISAARGDMSYEFDRQNGNLTYASSTTKEGSATIIIGSGRCKIAGPLQSAGRTPN